ncbi:MAG: hypothetical protein DRI69_04240 [Bacteroidetes bacterium]|nr:MAG: hypothetical protein DRI69_04240 [Bacteroidota bacterium]
MDSKLTLKLNNLVIERAKRYAKDHNQSLSKLIENYLQAITVEKDKGDTEISPLVMSLTGVITLDDDTDRGKYTDYLAAKYQ